MILSLLEGMTMFRRLSVIALLASALFFIGCSGSEEATEEGMESGEQATEEQAVEQAPAEEKSAEDQALTSFIGEKEPEAEAPAPVEAPKEEPAPEPQKVEEPKVEPQPVVENQVDPLREENSELKQRLMKLEQDAQMMAARISEAEAKLQAETERANRAEDALKTAPAPVAAAPRATASGSYEDALNAFMTKRYDDALDIFQGLLDAGAPKGYEDNCTYWLGESNYAKKQYAKAMEKFEAVLTYKVSEKKADAQFMIAQCLERTGKKAQAKEAYEKVVKEYPMSPLVKRAKERWARL